MRSLALVLLVLSACTELEVSTGQSLLTIGEGLNISLSSGNTNDLASNYCNSSYGACKLIGHASGSTLTGINGDSVGFGYGDLVYLRNVGTVPITLAHDSSSSSANRFHMRGNADIKLAPGRHVALLRSRDLDHDPMDYNAWFEYRDDSLWGPETVSTPSRSLGTAFQPSITRPVQVTYSASAACDITLSGGEEGRVELLSDSSNPPTTVRARVAECANTGTVVVGVALTVKTGGSVTYMVKPGDFVLLQSVNTTGTPSYAITAQTEQTL